MSGAAESRVATAPAVTGAAMEVPDMSSVEFSTWKNMLLSSTPGAQISIQGPKLLQGGGVGGEF